MPDPIRVCIFDRVAAAERSFRTPFEHLGNVKVMGEYASWDTLRDCLRFNGVDAVAVNLDDPAGAGFEVVQRIAQSMPTVGVIGLSERKDPQSIIRAMRAGCGQFVCCPIDLEDLRSALERIWASRAAGVQFSKRICVVGSSGGAGTTSIVCNLAMELAHLSQRRCGLVDLNLEFGDVACAFDARPKFSVADLCREAAELDRTLVAKAVDELPCNVSILARPENVNDATYVTPEALDHVLRIMAEMYPYVVIDLPRAFNSVNAVAIRGADHVLIVTQLGVPFIRNATRIYECLLHMGADESIIEVVINRCRASFERISPEEVASHFGRPVFAMIPNDYRRVQSALDLGHPIVADAPTSPARVAIQEMARQLLGTDSNGMAPVAAAAPSGGLLRKLWRKG